MRMWLSRSLHSILDVTLKFLPHRKVWLEPKSLCGSSPRVPQNAQCRVGCFDNFGLTSERKRIYTKPSNFTIVDCSRTSDTPRRDEASKRGRR